MRRMECAEVRAHAAEIALGLVSGSERDAAYRHLQGCAQCQEEVDSLARVVDELLIAAPSIEPPLGFESGVLARLAVEQPDHGEQRTSGAEPGPLRRRGALRWVATAAAAVLVAVGGVAVGRTIRHQAPPEVRAAAMVTPAGEKIGRIELGRDPATLFVAFVGWASWGVDGGRYMLRVSFADGRTTSVGPFELDPSKPVWGRATGFDTAEVRSVAMVGADGRVYCSARFS